MEEYGEPAGTRILLRIFISNPSLFVKSHEHAQQIFTVSSIDTILTLRKRVLERLQQISSIPSNSLYWFRIVFQYISWTDISANINNNSDAEQNNQILKSDTQKQDRLFSMQLRRNNTQVKSSASIVRRPNKAREIRRFYIPFDHENVISIINQHEQNGFCRSAMLVCLADIRALWNSNHTSVESSAVTTFFGNNGRNSLNYNQTDFISVSAFHPSASITLDNTVANMNTALSYDLAYLGSSGSFLQLSLDGCAMAQLFSPSSSSSVNTTSSYSSASALFLPPLNGNGQNTVVTAAAYSHLQLGQVAADAYFFEIANTAVIQGMLQRKVWIGSKGQEVWRY